MNIKKYSLLTLLLISACAMFASCGGTNNALITPPPRYSSAIDTGDTNLQGNYGTSPEYEIIGKAAYFFENESGKQLYGAVEYKNIGDCPMTVSAAEFTFTANEETLPHEFEPPAYKKHILLPGETAYLAAWLDYKSKTMPNEVILSEVKLTVEPADSARVRLDISNEFLVQNFPSFATVSGNITLEEADLCALNMIYIGFYDSEGMLLGVWSFTENVELTRSETAHFTSNMRSLLIDGLAEKTEAIKSIAFGIG